MIITDAADGIDYISHAHVNCYLVDSDEGVILVDAGVPRMWPMVQEALEKRGRTIRDIAALVLTHGHFDHVGFAARIHRELGIPVYVHPDDAFLAAHPYRYTPQNNRLLYPVTHPKSLPYLGRMALAGALTVQGVDDTSPPGHRGTARPAGFPGRTALARAHRRALHPPLPGPRRRDQWRCPGRPRPVHRPLRPADRRLGRDEGHPPGAELSGHRGGHRRGHRPSRPRRPLAPGRRECCGSRPGGRRALIRGGRPRDAVP